MVLLKTYPDFKLFHQRLLESLSCGPIMQASQLLSLILILPFVISDILT